MPTNRAAVRSAGAAAREQITLDGDAFMASLRRSVAALAITSEAALWVLGLTIQNNARILAPVDTGRLRSSIQARKGTDSRGPYVEIVAGTNYAAYVEFGTTRMAAQPYMRPAIAIAASRFGRMSGAV